jgi:hypothetical protein
VKAKNIAIVLFNLGGPDSPDSVKPFLYNLFNDKAIIGLPFPFRSMLAKLISSRRDATAREIYAHLDGASPLLPLTIQQANELEHELAQVDDGHRYKCFVCMRYWHPMTEQVVKEVKDWQADEILLVPALSTIFNDNNGFFHSCMAERSQTPISCQANKNAWLLPDRATFYRRPCRLDSRTSPKNHHPTPPPFFSPWPAEESHPKRRPLPMAGGTNGTSCCG